MRRSIRRKIMGSVIWITAAALVVGGMSAYLYFRSELLSRTIQDETIKLNMTAQQVSLVQEDIRQFAQYLLVDQEIQQKIHQIYAQDTYEQLSAEEWLAEQLNRYLLLKDYVNSVVLVSRDGRVVSTSRGDNPYFVETLQRPWYKQVENRKQHAAFSQIHSLRRDQIQMDTISYVIRYNTLLSKDNPLDQLIVHVRAERFTDLMPQESKDYMAYALLDAQGTPYYLAGHQPAQWEGRFTQGAEMFKDQQREYLVFINEHMYDGWQLVAVQSKRHLLSSIQYTIYVFIGAALLGMVVAGGLLPPVLNSITRPLLQLTQAMKQVSMNRIETTVSINSGDEIQALGEGFNRMLANLRAYMQQSLHDEQIKQRLELELLRSQINPHFIYNTLNTVIYMAQAQGNQDIVKMMESFIHILQDAIDEHEEGMTTVQRELDNLSHYDVIQRYRYPDRYQLQIKAEQALLAIPLPALLLQPLVENALLHGIIASERYGVIRVIVQAIDEHRMRIAVEDDGRGMDEQSRQALERGEEPPSRSSRTSSVRAIGLCNVRDRLYLRYPTAKLSIHSTPELGTRVELMIPITAVREVTHSQPNYKQDSRIPPL